MNPNDAFRGKKASTGPFSATRISCEMCGRIRYIQRWQWQDQEYVIECLCHETECWILKP